jgi:hypothetical protein
MWEIRNKLIPSGTLLSYIKLNKIKNVSIQASKVLSGDAQARERIPEGTSTTSSQASRQVGGWARRTQAHRLQAIRRQAVREPTSAECGPNHSLRGKVFLDGLQADRGSLYSRKVLRSLQEALEGAVNAEVARGKAGGLYVDQKLVMTGNIDNLSTDEIKDKLKKILDDNKEIINITPEDIELDKLELQEESNLDSHSQKN